MNEEIIVETLREIKSDIKDLEKSVSDIRCKVGLHSHRYQQLDNLDNRLENIDEKVDSLERFRSRTKGFGSAIAFLAATLGAYFKSKGGM